MGRNKNIKDLSGGKIILFLFVLSVVFQPADIENAFYIKILYICMYSYKTRLCWSCLVLKKKLQVQVCLFVFLILLCTENLFFFQSSVFPMQYIPEFNLSFIFFPSVQIDPDCFPPQHLINYCHCSRGNIPSLRISNHFFYSTYVQTLGH